MDPDSHSEILDDLLNFSIDLFGAAPVGSLAV